jgi:maltooligosyltrehalose trehalohydrolase
MHPNSSAGGIPLGARSRLLRPQTRSYFIENALYWLTDFRFDGLRFDASDLLVADNQTWLVDNIADRVRNEIHDRIVHLVVEDARDVPGPLDPPDGRPASFRAAWNDDFHHAVHVLTTGETVGHYSDFADDPRGGLRTALAEGFIDQGQPRASKDGEPSGEPSGHLPPTCFVNFLQNHDQIGNRLKGDRLSALIDARTFKALTAMLYLSPHIPLTFMGEEFATPQSFFFFSDYPPETHEEALKARLTEANNFGGTLSRSQCAPDILRSKIDWRIPEEERSLSWQSFMKELLALRRARIWPMLADLPSARSSILPAPENVIAVNWELGDHVLELRCNLGSEPAEATLTSGEVFFQLQVEHGETALPPGATIFAAPAGATKQDPSF